MRLQSALGFFFFNLFFFLFFLSSRAAQNTEECLKTAFEAVHTCQVSLKIQSTVNNHNVTAPNSQPRTAQHSKMFHHLSHTAHWAISIHNVLKFSWTSHKTIQMNSKHSQSLIKASKSFSIHKVCFHDRGLFKFQCFFFFSVKWIEQFANHTMWVCPRVSVCVCVYPHCTHTHISVCYCFWVFSPELGWPLAQHVRRQTSPLLCSPHFYSSACLQPLCSFAASDEIFT